MALHRRRAGETVAQEQKRLKRRNTGHNTAHGRKRPTLPSQASPKARAAVAKTRPTRSTKVRAPAGTKGRRRSIPLRIPRRVR